MLYDLVKSAHIISLIVFLACMTAAALVLRSPSPAILPAMMRFDRRVTTPAMILAWALGILLVVQGNWFESGGWIGVKIFLVIVLSGLHGMDTGRLRRKVREAETRPDEATRFVLPAGLGLVLAIVVLVTTKGF